MADVEKDLRNLGVVNWKTKAKEQYGWRRFLEQVKTTKDFSTNNNNNNNNSIQFNSYLFTC
jgi:hypothetical protein